MIAARDVMVRNEALGQDVQIVAGTEVPRSLLKAYKEAVGDVEKATRAPATDKAERGPDVDKAGLRATPTGVGDPARAARRR